ncbi:hypothetical protein [Cylindrospermopsis raciborskii]|nr:hypothetical protein [Cylindrospermopsis raciborskii]
METFPETATASLDQLLNNAAATASLSTGGTIAQEVLSRLSRFE